MEKNRILHKRKNGIYYTPADLAIHLASSILQKGNVSVFDPAYGSGALLLAAEKVFSKKSSNGDKLNLFGCDTHPVNGLLRHMPQANLREMNFFQYSTSDQFNLILTNPPYIRRQNQEVGDIDQYRNLIKEFEILNNKADLWAYFIIKSVLHLKENGSIGAILPWAFIQADYAQPLRKWLFNQFASIKVLALNNPFFESADERVLLIWMKDFGYKTSSLKFAYSSDIKKRIQYQEIRKQDWLGSKVIPFQNNDLEKILLNLKQIGFNKFSNFADAKIGIVTGANDFFIKKLDEFTALKIKEDKLEPILTGAKNIPDFLSIGNDALKRLICLDKNDFTDYKSFISSGEELNYHLRAHSRNRHTWYCIKTGKIPDAFFPYRVARIPYLVLNKSKIQSTNSVHRIYFKGLNKTEIKWVHVSILSIYGQLLLEVNSKTYGRGMLKIEPSALGKILVFKKNDRSIEKTYNQLIKLLIQNKKEEASDLATTFIDKKLGISPDLNMMTINVLNLIRSSKKR